MRYISNKRLLLSSMLLMVVMAAVSSAYIGRLGGQNKNGEDTAENATVRESNKKLRAREGFRFVQDGKNKVSVRRYSTGVKVKGDISCFCEADKGGSSGAFCDARTSSDGKSTTCAEYGCTGCGMRFSK